MILGATLYGKQSEELINIIKLAIDQNIPYTVLRDIFIRILRWPNHLMIYLISR